MTEPSARGSFCGRPSRSKSGLDRAPASIKNTVRSTSDLRAPHRLEKPTGSYFGQRPRLGAVIVKPFFPEKKWCETRGALASITLPDTASSWPDAALRRSCSFFVPDPNFLDLSDYCLDVMLS